MIGKLVATGISIILVAGVIIGVIAVVHHSGGSQNIHDSVATPKIKAVNQFCEPTGYKNVCQKTLSSVNSTEPKELLKEVVLATQQAIQKSFNMSEALIVKATQKDDSSSKMAMEDCKELLDFAVQELQASYSIVDDTDLHNMDKRVSELMSWLNAVITYQQVCLDGFEGQNNTFKSAMQDGFVDATRLTSNVIAVVSKLSEILNSFGLEIKWPKSLNRRLLQVENDDFPIWLSLADRKLLAATRQKNGGVTPNAVVAKDGTGQFETIQAALDAYPKILKGRYVIYVKAGIYDEYITVKEPNVLMYGDGSDKTVVTGRKSFAAGIKTMKTATFAAVGKGFIAKDMGFSNTAGPEGHQAVALRVQSDASAFFNCRMDGYQDTLYTMAHRQFYSNCSISGTVDFIFGDAFALIQNSQIIVRKPGKGQKNAITAQGKKDPKQTTALVIQNCNIVAEDKLLPERFTIQTFLGRPWKDHATTIFLENIVPDFIDPEGYMPFRGAHGLKTCQYLEFGNTGPGSVTNQRVKWPGVRVINRDEAMRYTVQSLFSNDLQWLKDSGVPFDLALKTK